MSGLLQTLFGTVFALFVAPRIEEHGHRLSVAQARNIGQGLTVVSIVVVGALAWSAYRRLTRR